MDIFNYWKDITSNFSFKTKVLLYSSNKFQNPYPIIGYKVLNPNYWCN